ATSLGHHHVEDHQVGIVALGYGQTLVTIASHHHAIASRFKGESHCLDDFGIVVDEQNAFGGQRGGRVALIAGILLRHRQGNPVWSSTVWDGSNLCVAWQTAAATSGQETHLSRSGSANQAH